MIGNSLLGGKDKYSCGDDTLNGFCSENLPYFCSKGVLVERASLCGCPTNLVVEENSCFSPLQTNLSEISLKYFLDGEERKMNFSVYEGMADYTSQISREIVYFKGDVPSRADFKLKKLDEENQKQLLMPLVVNIQNLGREKEDQMRIAISIVQNIEWGISNKTSRFGHNQINYSRYPYEVLFESKGICGEKSELLAFLLREIGFDVALFYNQQENHESLGIKCPAKYSWHDSGYCFVETTGPSIITDTSIEYLGGLSLSSIPQIIPISEGISLGKNLEEYNDAEDLMKIRKKVMELGRINSFDKSKLEELEEKYGLVEEYNAG